MPALSLTASLLDAATAANQAGSGSRSNDAAGASSSTPFSQTLQQSVANQQPQPQPKPAATTTAATDPSSGDGKVRGHHGGHKHADGSDDADDGQDAQTAATPADATALAA
ncbi:flagellar hook-length control protein FliK, partial [Burkholderia sp. Cy-647]|nr:flagellar hook-length control protein FliK [Burkholderia sp. Cy-647]